MTFNHRLSMGLECRAGADGILTLSVGVPDTDAVAAPASLEGKLAVANARGSDDISDSKYLAPQQLDGSYSDAHGENSTTACATSGAATAVGVSSTLSSSHSTKYSCHGPGPSSSSLDLQVASASLLQEATMQQVSSTSTYTSSLVITPSPNNTISVQSESCKTMSSRANTTMMPPSQVHLSLSFAAATQSSMPLESSDCFTSSLGSIQALSQPSSAPSLSSWSNLATRASDPALPGSIATDIPCFNSSFVRVTTPVAAGLSAAGFSSRVNDLTGSILATSIDTAARERATTGCSSDENVNSATGQLRSASTSQALAPLGPVFANVTTAISSPVLVPTTSVSASTLTTSTSPSMSSQPATTPPTYTTVELPGPPAYFPPLAAYSYNIPQEYEISSISTLSSSFVAQDPSTLTTSSGSAGIMGSPDATKDSDAASSPPGSYPFLYSQAPQLDSSPPDTPRPVQTAQNDATGLLETTKIHEATGHEEEKSVVNDWAKRGEPRSTSADETWAFGPMSEASSPPVSPQYVMLTVVFVVLVALMEADRIGVALVGGSRR